jgi:putative two-component system response regulator
MADRSPSRAAASATILVVDDEEANLNLLQRLLERAGYRVLRAHDGDEALDAVPRERPDVVLSGVRMRGRDGFQICRLLKHDPATRLTPVILMTGSSDADDRLRAIDAGADDLIARPIEPTELKARVRSLVQLKRFTDDLDSAEAVLRNLAIMVEARDPYTDGHCQRLMQYARLLGERLNLSAEQLSTLGRGAYFHDIGKISIPDSILLKPGALTPEEYARIREHPLTGERLCGNFRALHQVRPIVRWHHELVDGTGYPDGLRGDAIPLLAQIVGIIDVFDALTSTRPYRQAMPAEQAVAELLKDVRSGRRDRYLIEEFVALVEQHQLGRLSVRRRR